MQQSSFDAETDNLMINNEPVPMDVEISITSQSNDVVQHDVDNYQCDVRLQSGNPEMLISPRDETGTRIAQMHSSEQNSGDLTALQADTVTDFTERALEQCRAEAKNYSQSKLFSDQLARRYLILIAKIVHSPLFSIEELAKLRRMRITKKQIKNPFLSLMRAADPGRGIKVQSKQAQALIFALRECDNKVDRLEQYFQTMSIKRCIKALREEKKSDNDGRDSDAIKGLTLLDFPQNISGEVTIKLRVESSRKARFLSIVKESELG